MYKFEDADSDSSSDVSCEGSSNRDDSPEGGGQNASAEEVDHPGELMSSNNRYSYRSDVSSATFLDVVERKVGQMPEYLKNMIFLNGFAVPQLFGKLSVADIAPMENYVRNVMPKICPPTPEYFSVFCENVSEFKLPLGHQNLLLAAVEKVHADCESITREVTKMKQKMEERANRAAAAKKQIEERRLKGNSQEADVDAKIANKIKNLTRQWTEKTDLGSFDKSLIDVDKMSVKLVNVGQHLFAEVICPICRHHIKIGIWSNKHNKKPRLILSNLNSHIRIHAKKENQKRGVSSTTTADGRHEEAAAEEQQDGTSRRTRQSSARHEAAKATPRTLGEVYSGTLLESIGEFWLGMEMEFGNGEEIVPRYLQNFLHLMGFGTRKALSLLREEDFAILERYARQKMRLWTERDPENIDFFLGPFSRTVDDFEIALGHRRQLIELKEALANQMEFNGKTKVEKSDPIGQQHGVGDSSAFFAQVLLKEYKSEETD